MVTNEDDKKLYEKLEATRKQREADRAKLEERQDDFHKDADEALQGAYDMYII